MTRMIDPLFACCYSQHHYYHHCYYYYCLIPRHSVAVVVVVVEKGEVMETVFLMMMMMTEMMIASVHPWLTLECLSSSWALGTHIAYWSFDNRSTRESTCHIFLIHYISVENFMRLLI